MSIQSEINRIQGNVNSAFAAVQTKGGTIPSVHTSDDLATAITSIPSGSGTIEPLTITTNGIYTASGDIDGYSPITVNVETSVADIHTLLCYSGLMISVPSATAGTNTATASYNLTNVEDYSFTSGQRDIKLMCTARLHASDTKDSIYYEDFKYQGTSDGYYKWVVKTTKSNQFQIRALYFKDLHYEDWKVDYFCPSNMYVGVRSVWLMNTNHIV